MIEELVRILQIDHPGLRVVVNGYDDGYDDLLPKQVSLVQITLNTSGRGWVERYSDFWALRGQVAEEAEVVEALDLQRTSN